jgi:hypothetical protein
MVRPLLTLRPVRTHPVAVASLLALSALSLSAVGCGPRQGTRLDPIAPQTAVVGVELGVMLRAATASHVEFDFQSDLEMDGRRVKPTLTTYAHGEAMFRWTPLASDVGDHKFRFSATVDGVPASELVYISVVSGADPISFRSPVGEGTTLDLTRTPCAVVPLLVDDTSATAVELTPGDGWVDGATLEVQGPLSGRLRFCPSKAQAMARTIFPFTIVATDDGGARAEKRYTIVLGKLAPPVVAPPPPDPTPNPNPNPNPNPMPVNTCDTTAPTVMHTAHANLTTVGNPHIYATIADKHGIYGAGVFWSTTAPADPNNPDLFAMNYQDMSLLSGTVTNGEWGATIPSPVINSPAGTTATIYYLVAVTDDDDAVAGCQYHATFVPAQGVYSFVIKRANGG